MLLTEMKLFGRTMMEAKAWGVEDLSLPERAQKVIEAGVDQFGGEACPEVIVELVRSGRISEERIDSSVRRLLREKFRLGLFDNPYLDADQSAQVIGQEAFREAGRLAQMKSYVLLKNGLAKGSPVLPLSGKPRIYIEGLDEEIAQKYGQVVPEPAEADFAILRLSTPFEKRRGIIERFMHGGDLDFKSKEKERLLKILETVPTIVDIYLERPAVLPEIADKAAALLANFGAEDDVALVHLDLLDQDHQVTQPGAVEETHLLKIDDDLVVLLDFEGLDLGAGLGQAIDVDLARRLQNEDAINDAVANHSGSAFRSGVGAS